MTVPDGDYKRRVIVDDQAAIVREIFERYARGESSKNNRVRRALGWVHTTIVGAYSKADGIVRNPI